MCDVGVPVTIGQKESHTERRTMSRERKFVANGCVNVQRIGLRNHRTTTNVISAALLLPASSHVLWTYLSPGRIVCGADGGDSAAGGSHARESRDYYERAVQMIHGSGSPFSE